MSVADLLSFWQQIPESMGHFHPEVATTSDVVWQAVIPLSSLGSPGVVTGSNLGLACWVTKGSSLKRR